MGALFPHDASWLPKAQPRQHVTNLLPPAYAPCRTGRPHPLTQRPSRTLSGSTLPQRRSWPKPRAQPRQQVRKGRPDVVTPGCTWRPQPFVQNPCGTPAMSGVRWSMTRLSFSFHAASPNFVISSRVIRNLSSSIQVKVQPCFWQIAINRFSSAVPRCRGWATSLSTFLANSTAPWIWVSLYFMAPTLEESPNTAASPDLAIFIVSRSSSSLNSWSTWA
mmetsp:Transcript_98222/g.274994  ORF Transcript_98222/g.274994 Transcript_98222/m.274994 type:complete len:219 (+) Transcript_98222:286-942(+)